MVLILPALLLFSKESAVTILRNASRQWILENLKLHDNWGIICTLVEIVAKGGK